LTEALAGEPGLERQRKDNLEKVRLGKTLRSLTSVNLKWTA
jgi:hypothetical protein